MPAAKAARRATDGESLTMMTKFTASMAGMVGLLIAVATPAAAARWHGSDDLQGAILETPSCVSWGPGRIDCFVVGSNRRMYHIWYG
jgi:hypothetical protein